MVFNVIISNLLNRYISKHKLIDLVEDATAKRQNNRTPSHGPILKLFPADGLMVDKEMDD